MAKKKKAVTAKNITPADKKKLASPRPVSLSSASKHPPTDGSWVRYVNLQTPIFYRFFVPEMRIEPHLSLAFETIKSIVSTAEFEVKVAKNHSDANEVGEYVLRQVERFWVTSAPIALRSMEYGWAPFEVMYRLWEGELEFDHLLYRRAERARPVIKNGRVQGVVLHPHGNAEDSEQDNEQNVERLDGIKKFWCVHSRDHHPIWGDSRYRGPHIPWFQYRSQGGYTQSESIWMRKFASNMHVVHYPQGGQTDTEGNPVQYSQIAAEVLYALLNNSGVAIPRGMQEQDNWDVQTIPAQPGDSLFAVGDRLEERMLIAAGVPPEIITSDGSGAYAGRRIPMTTFLCMCQYLAQEVIEQFMEQIVEPLISLKFDNPPPVRVHCKSFMELMNEENRSYEGPTPANMVAQAAKPPTHHRLGGDPDEHHQ